MVDESRPVHYATLHGMQAFKHISYARGDETRVEIGQYDVRKRNHAARSNGTAFCTKEMSKDM